LTVDLPPEALRRIETEATRRGISVDGIIAELASGLPGPSSNDRHDPAFVGIGASGRGITNRVDEILRNGCGSD